MNKSLFGESKWDYGECLNNHNDHFIFIFIITLLFACGTMISQFTYFSDQASGNQSYAFDGLTATYYGSSNTDCWFGMDAGAGM